MISETSETALASAPAEPKPTSNVCRRSTKVGRSRGRFYLNKSRTSFGKESSGFSQPTSKYFSQTLAHGRL